MILGTLKKRPSRDGLFDSQLSGSGVVLTTSSRNGVAIGAMCAVGSTSRGIEPDEVR